MTMKLAQIILYSQDQNSLALFLSELMDIELEKLSEGIRLKGDEHSFLIVGPTPKSPGPSDLMLDFELEERQDLEDFWQKFQFLKYRYELPEHSGGKITHLDSMSFFVLHDPDGRKWKFSCRYRDVDA